MSGLGNGYLSGNMLVAFPFEDGQCLAWGSSEETNNELQSALQKCFVDASVFLNSEELSSSCWPVIGAFSIANGAISFRIGCGPRESDVRLSVVPSSMSFPIVSGSAAWGHYMLVLSSEGIGDFVALCNGISISPPAQDSSSSPGRDGGFWLRLCAKCITVRPHGVTSIKVFDGVNPRESGPHFVMKGDISIRPGNNMRLLEPEEGNGIELNAIPGAGFGKCPCICEDVPSGNSQLAGPDGHARLFNDTCYDLEPSEKYYDPALGRMSQMLKIHVKCTACCTCEMYEEIVNGRLVSIANAVRKAKTDIESMLSKYEQAVSLFNSRMEVPKMSDISMTMSAMPVGRNLSPKIGNQMVKGKMSRCAYTVVVRNSSFFEIIAKPTRLSGTNKIVESSASWSDEQGHPLSKTGDSALAVVDVAFSIYPGRSLVITYISSKSEKVSSVVTGGFSGSAFVDLSYRKPDGSIAYLGRISKSVDA